MATYYAVNAGGVWTTAATIREALKKRIRCSH